MMTEDEAKTKECCGPPALHPHRDSERCSGSACMAWRRELRRFHIERNHFIRENESYSSTDITEMLPTGHGFCGLAGRPE